MKKDNIPGFPGYYISKRGRVFSRIELKPQGNLKEVPYKVVNRKIKLINSDRNKYLTYLYTTLNIF